MASMHAQRSMALRTARARYSKVARCPKLGFRDACESISCEPSFTIMLHLSRVHVRYPVQVLYRTITSQWSGLASDDDGDMAAVSTLVFAELQACTKMTRFWLC